MILHVWCPTWYNSSAVGVNRRFETSVIWHQKFKDFFQKLWAKHMYVQIWYESQRLQKKGTTSFKTQWNAIHFWICNSLQKHFLFSSQTWNPDDTILETYAPESSCQSQIIYKDLQHSSRRGTRRSGHSRSCHTRWSGRHTRWSGQVRRRTIVVSRWEWWWKSIQWDRHAAITRHRRHRSLRWWGQTRRWHWLSRIHCHTTALCWCRSNLSPPLRHLLVTFHFRALMLLFRLRMLKLDPLGFYWNWRWTLCRSFLLQTFFHDPLQALHRLRDLIRHGCQVYTGYLSRISAKFRFTVAIRLPALLLTSPDFPSFPPVLNSSAVHCKFFKSFTRPFTPFLMWRK